jgi:hypothetical protein
MGFDRGTRPRDARTCLFRLIKRGRCAGEIDDGYKNPRKSLF